MSKSVPRWRRSGLYALIGISIFAFSVACSLTQGLDAGGNTSTPQVDVDSAGSSPSDDSSGATIIDESASSEDSASDSSEDGTAAGPTEEEADESAAADDESQEQAALAANQVFILPGGDPPTMDPHLSGDAASAEYVVEIYSGLMAYDRDLNLVPDVAESYDVSADGLLFTFNLREDAQFQDGKPIRAEDFKWSFERACDPATGSSTADTYLGDIVGCRAKLQGEASEVTGVEVVDEEAHVGLCFTFALEAVCEALDGHVGEGEELVELDPEVELELALVVLFGRCLGWWEEGAARVVYEVELEG